MNNTEKTKVWAGHIKIEKGIRHEKQRMKCQDYAEMEQRNGRISIALLDGKGNGDVNALAVKNIAKILNDFMLSFFDEIYTRDDNAVAYNLMLQIERKIGELSKEYEVNYEELASTLLAFCVDEQKKQYCAVHLGDGVIAIEDCSKTIEILSLPINGINKNQTILTTSQNALENVKIYRGTVDDIKGVVLASDGIYNGQEDMKELESCFSETIENVILKQKMDDQAMITISM